MRTPEWIAYVVACVAVGMALGIAVAWWLARRKEDPTPDMPDVDCYHWPAWTLEEEDGRTYAYCPDCMTSWLSEPMDEHYALDPEPEGDPADIADVLYHERGRTGGR